MLTIVPLGRAPGLLSYCVPAGRGIGLAQDDSLEFSISVLHPPLDKGSADLSSPDIGTGTSFIPFGKHAVMMTKLRHFWKSGGEMSLFSLFAACTLAKGRSNRKTIGMAMPADRSTFKG